MSRPFIIVQMATSKHQALCSVESIEAQEQLVGTAPRADVWFLLEVPGRWGNKALKESSIPDEVKTYLETQVTQVPEARLLLIKRSQESHEGITFFAAISTAQPPVLYRFNMRDYTELFDLDFSAIANQDPRFESSRIQEPLFVMCTNGLRDQCCAVHGLACYQALSKSYPGLVWESTHHGGHRFAANFLHLPHGLSFGRLRPDSAPDVVQMGLDGRIAFYHYRGRTIYPEPIQAAEALLRRGIGIEGVDALSLQHSEQLSDGQWRARFAGAGDIFEIIVQGQETGAQVHLSCGDEKLSPVVEYFLVENPASIN
jgi:hypothetical protein